MRECVAIFIRQRKQKRTFFPKGINANNYLQRGAKTKIGVLVNLGNDIDATFKKVADIGLDNCQLACWDHSRMNDDSAEKMLLATQKHGVEISAFWCGWSGPAI